MPLRSPGTSVARTDAEIVEAVEDSAVTLAAGSTVGGTAIASTDDVRTDSEIVAAVEASATLDLNAAAKIGTVQIASTDDVRTDAEIVAAVEASATLDLNAGATIDGSGIVSDSDLAAVELDDLADVSVASPSDQDVLTWDDGTSTWVAQAAGGGVSGDVSTSIELTRTTAVSTGADSIAIGNGASSSGDYSVSIGQNSEADHYAKIGIGFAAGYSTGASNPQYGVFIGVSSSSINGFGGQNNGQYAVAVGNAARMFDRATESVSIGRGALCWAPNTIAIGRGANAHRSGSTHLRSDTGGAAYKNATVNSYRFRDLHHVVEMRASTNATATSKEATATGAENPANTVTVIATDTYDRNVVVLADGKVVGFVLNMTAIQDTTNDAACYEIIGAAKCIGGTASIIGTNTTVAKEDDASWNCTVTCTSNRLVVTCTADASGTATWRGILTLTYDG